MLYEVITGRAMSESGVICEVDALNDMAKNLILWVVIAIVLMTVFNNFSSYNFV